nr:hypothetical protein [Pseudomonas sp. efr-133-TYG-103a]
MGIFAMMSASYRRLLSVALRSLTLGCKFVLVFFLARLLNPEDLGLYGLMVVTVSYALYVLGFDFYTYTTRELLKYDRSRWGEFLKSQVALTAVLYALAMPGLSILFYQDLLPWALLSWFFALLVLEHLNQELSRLLVAVSEQLTVSVMLFVRSGAWAILVTALMYYDEDYRTLPVVLGAWLIGGGVAMVIALHKLSRLNIGGWRADVDWRWIATGLKVAVPLVIATLALRGISTVDRYWFEHTAGLRYLGAYVLFGGLSAALISFLDAGVFSFIYPNLIKLHHEKKVNEFNDELKKLMIHTVFVSLAFSIIAFLAIDPMLEWLGKDVYIQQRDLFPWILAGTVLSGLSMIPHYGLYAKGIDAPIIKSHLVGFVVFCGSAWILVDQLGALGIPVAVCVAQMMILCWKTLSFVLQHNMLSSRIY